MRSIAESNSFAKINSELGGSTVTHSKILRAGLAALLLAVAPASSQAARLLAPGGGAVRALVVGINNYPKLPYQSLKGALPDADDLAAVLEKAGVSDLVALPNERATRADFVANMDRLIATSKPGDLVIITYSGHGTQVPAYSNWKDVDGRLADEQIVLSGFAFKGPAQHEAIVNYEMRAWLSRLDAKGVDAIVVWDSCFGGGMRGVEAEGGPIQVRAAHQTPDAKLESTFPSIAMTAAEARADIKTMSHVTFLAGATDDSVVPEMPGVDPAHPNDPRGALSYFLARAMEGQLKSGPVSRVELFKFLAQNVSEKTAQRQIIEAQPQRRGDNSVSGRTVFVVAGDVADNPASPRAPTPVRLAIVDGPSDAFASIEKRSTTLQLVADRDQAELVWDVGAKKAFAKGDTLMEGVDGSMIGWVADRVRALSRLQEVGSGRPLEIGLSSGGELLTPGHHASVQVLNLDGAKLVVFNIAADGTIQMQYPSAPDAKEACQDPAAGGWTCNLGVVAPFGVDTLVAVATAQPATRLLDWLREHRDRRDAAQLPEVVTKLLADDPSAKVGFTALVTRATAY
jgi:hypothetical protein